jgi:hypothetical protein
MRRWLPVRPMAWCDSESAHPMRVEAALRAVRHPRLELALEIGLHLQELEPEHLRVDRDGVIASTSSLRIVDELVRLRRVLSNGVDGVLEDLALSACHVREG